MLKTTHEDKRNSKEPAWLFQWSILDLDPNETLELFRQYISPYKLADFRGKKVLDAGCGQGQVLSLIAPLIQHGVGVDLNTAPIAEKNNENNANIKILGEDLASMDLKQQFDIVYSLGVIHHVHNPHSAFRNLAKHVRPGGILIFYVYSDEKNILANGLLRCVKKELIGKMNRKHLYYLCWIPTLVARLVALFLYRLPIRWLPHRDLMHTFRKLSLRRQFGTIFDALNAPHTIFFKKHTIEQWFHSSHFQDVQIRNFKTLCWCASGKKPED